MTDRSKVANVRSMLQQQQDKAERRGRKDGRSMVPVEKPTAGARQLKAANDSVSLADRARADLANMHEPLLFNDKQLDLLGIVHPRCKDRKMVDAMRQLRTKLYQLQPEKNFSVMVSSVVPEGGGSFVSMNLAATIAFDQAKTSMIVEANLHAPILHKLMKLMNSQNWA